MQQLKSKVIYIYIYILGRRPYMEDRLVVIPNVANTKSSLYCVCDGHGGAEAANFVVNNLEKVLLNILNSSSSFKANNVPENFSYKDCLIQTFKTLDNEFIKIAEERKLSDGTTLLCALLTKTHLTIANTGDSRALLIRDNWTTTPLSIGSTHFYFIVIRS